MTKKEKSRKVETILCFLPSVLLIGIFFVGPMVMAVMFSFTDIALTGSSANTVQFVGLKNFAEVFEDPKLFTVLKNTMIFLIFSGIIGQQCLGFFIASLMQGKGSLIRRFVGLAVVLGWVVPEVVAAFAFNAFFSDGGTLNKIMNLFGGSSVSWMYMHPMMCVVIANIWKGTAYCMMMFQASLDNIPGDILEQARIDGANAFQILTRITIPMLKGTLAITFVLVTLGTLGAFGLIYAMTGGGPGISTTTLSVFMYQKAFIGYDTGYGMAIALFMLLIGIVMSVIYLRLVRANEE